MKAFKSINPAIGLLLISVVACGHAEKTESPPAAPAAVAVTETVPPSVVKAPQVPEPQKSAAPVPEKEKSYSLKKGFLTNQGPRPQLVAKLKNEKTPGFTTDTCWNYGEFAVLETKSTGEIGSAEVVVRYKSAEHKKLCGAEFKGRVKALNITEGHFAGVVGDYVFIEGDDLSEGLAEFQIFSISTGQQVFRSSHHQGEEFTVKAKGDQIGLQFFAKLKVPCELAADGAECWKKVLSTNGVRRATSMPDCKSTFSAAKVGEFEPALVTTLARVADVKNPKVEFLGGRATCQPAP